MNFLHLVLLVGLTAVSINCQDTGSSALKDVVVDSEIARAQFNNSWYQIKYVGDAADSFSDTDHFYIGVLWDYDGNLVGDSGASFALYTKYRDDVQNQLRNSPNILAPVEHRFKEIRSIGRNEINQCDLDIDVEFVFQNIVIGVLRWQGSYRREEAEQCYSEEESWKAFASKYIGANVSTHIN